MSVISELEKLQKVLKNHLVEVGHFKSIEDVEQELLKSEHQILASNLFRSSNTSYHYKRFTEKYSFLEKPNFEAEDISLIEKFKNIINYI